MFDAVYSCPEQTSVSGGSRDSRRWLLWVDGSDQPPQAYHLDLDKGRAMLIDEAKPWLDTAKLAPSTAIKVTARDGLVLDAFDPGFQMRQLMEAAGQKLPEVKPILEINPAHRLVERLAGEADEARFRDLALVLLDQAALAEGAQLEDPAAYVRRIQSLL